MKKGILITLSLLLAFLSGFRCEAAGSGGQEATLIHGKWVNKAGGYIPNAMGVGDNRVERYKTYNFEADGSFTLDSLKQRYSGTWELQGNTLILTFKPRTVTQFSKNLDPNSSGSGYATTDMLVDLGVRTGTLSGDLLKFPGVDQDAKHHADAVAGMMNFWEFTGFANTTSGNLIMILVALGFIWLAIRFDYEPLLLIPIGIGIIIGNIPFYMAEGFNLGLGIYEPGSVFNILYQGVVQGWYPPLIFLGIGAMTDFSSLI
ncbi:MAG: sodium ion-translocating decarboxylase subunit beta, partial [Culturomica sp.]|nr:sodium ion-translocating decarboxylase subunit beta [Culturomica sp.]